MINFKENSATVWNPWDFNAPTSLDKFWVLLPDYKTAIEVTVDGRGFHPVNDIKHPLGFEPILRFDDVVAWNESGWVEPPTPSGQLFESPRMLLKAIRFATQAHEGQRRKFQDVPYIAHPTAVAKFVELLGGNTRERVVALLHDTVEDAPVTLDQITDQFGISVSDLVDELTIDKSDPMYDGNAGKLQYLKIHMLEMSESALFIKLCDRLDNVSDLKMITDIKFLNKYVVETLEILNHLTSYRSLSRRNREVVGIIQKAVEDASHFTFLTEVYKQQL